jgi:VWFA-related protein
VTLVRLLVTCVVASAIQAPAFHVETRLVVLHVTVRNARGELVPALGRGAFTVFENGRRQTIALFRNDDVPVSLGLLIDNSGSMRSKRSRVEAAALAFVKASNPQDEVFVLNFADKARIDVPFTSDIRQLEAGISRVDSIGGTAMRDAVAEGEQYLDDNATRDRRALVIITDGNDNASETTLERIRTRAQQRDVAIFAVGLLASDEGGTRQARHELNELTGSTGGLVHYPGTLAEIESVALELARQIRAQYTMAYAPSNQSLDGSYRRIKVEAKGREPLTVHTRTGYRASPDVLPPRPGS